MKPRDLRHQGIVLLNTRINFHGGRAPVDRNPHDGYNYWNGWHEDWTVVRMTPKGKVWATSTWGLRRERRVAHQIKYQLIATHKAGTSVTMTVWACGRRASTAITQDITGLRKCWTCQGRESQCPS